MNQVTHTCLGIRAIGLLEDANEDPRLVELLKTGVNNTSLGAWLPDLTDSKIGSGKIDNHVLKMLPMTRNDKYFVVSKEELIKQLGNERKVCEYLKNDVILDSNWWNTAYKAEPTPGQHLGNRANALSIAITDILLLGDDQLSILVPGSVGFHKDLGINIQTQAEQAGCYFFMLSHFIADACMPMHCDARKINGFSSGLHHEWEMHWSKALPKLFDKKNILSSTLSSNDIVLESKKMDQAFQLSFSNVVPKIDKKTDIWKEVIMMCRGSFALSCIVNPLTQPYDIEQAGKTFEELESTEEGKKLIHEIDAVVMHDAVLSIAIIWKHIWSKFHED